MIHWQSKSDLITWLQKHAPTKGVERALHSGGGVTNLGGFDPLPGSNSPGYIVKVTSQAQRVYCVAITIDTLRPPRTFLPDYIDWKTYIGIGWKDGLYRGDQPCFARHQKLNSVFERVNQ